MPKKHSEFINHLNELLEVMTSARLSRLIGVADSRIPEWRRGLRLPSPDTLIKLGKVALEHKLPDPFFFWALAGIDTETLRRMAGKVIEERSVPLVEGEIIRIPEFRETFQGREAAGPPIALPARFIPHPLNTICLSVDEKSTTVVDVPRGLFILDTSIEGVESLSDLWGRVIMLRYEGRVEDFPEYPDGLYTGRPQLKQNSFGAENPTFSAFLEMLGRESGHYILPLGSFSAQSAFVKGMTREELNRCFAEARERAKAELRLNRRVRVLGKVIGRLTGHLEGQREK